MPNVPPPIDLQMLSLAARGAYASSIPPSSRGSPVPPRSKTPGSEGRKTPSNGRRSHTPSLSARGPGRATPGLEANEARSRSGALSARASPAPSLGQFDDEEDPEAELLLATARSRVGVKLFPFTPQSKSIVDQVVFNRDIDNSGEDLFSDPQFLQLFQDSAGRPSWKEQSAGKQMKPKHSGDAWGTPDNTKRDAPPRGRRKFHSMPLASSVVDTVVFGRDIDQSGGELERFRETAMIHKGAAGSPSWVSRSQGIGSTARSRRVRQAMLAKTSRGFQERLAKDIEAKAPRNARFTVRRGSPAEASEVGSLAAIQSVSSAASSSTRQLTSASSLPYAVAEALAMMGGPLAAQEARGKNLVATTPAARHLPV